ncbi:MAG: hypothetical protein ABI758_01425 [Candidatus Woesebacteria bacterium]
MADTREGQEPEAEKRKEGVDTSVQEVVSPVRDDKPKAETGDLPSLARILGQDEEDKTAHDQDNSRDD